MHDYESLSVEAFEGALDVVAKLHEDDPPAHLFLPLQLLEFVLEHGLFDRSQDFPLVQLEKTIFLVKLLLFVLVEIGNFTKKLTSMLAHLKLNLLFCAVNGRGLFVYFLEVDLSLRLFDEGFEKLIVFFFKLLHFKLFLASQILLLCDLIFGQCFVELFHFFWLS